MIQKPSFIDDYATCGEARRKEALELRNAPNSQKRFPAIPAKQ
jgi:hypothetical protein